MDKQLDAAVGFDRESMVGFENFTDSTVNRGNHFVAGRFDGNTVANDFFSKYYVRHIFDINDFARKWSYDLDSARVFLVIRNQRFQFIEQTHDLLLSSNLGRISWISRLFFLQ
ncbi:hypothetical protein D3C87_1593600 [compost metagenome]